MRINKFFLKILSCFLAVVFVLSLAFAVARFEDLRIDKDHVLENLDIEFEGGAKGMQRTLLQIKYALSELSVRFAADRSFEDGTYLEGNELRADMRAVLVDRRQNEFSKYLTTAFIVDTLKQNYVYELTGTFTTDVFFNQYYVNETYTNEYWLSETEGGDSFKIFPANIFSTAREAKRVDIELLPITYKPHSSSRYIIVMLIDINAIAEHYGISGMYSKNGETVYSVQNLTAEDVFSAKDGYVFEFDDEYNGNLNIVKFVPASDVSRVVGNARRVSTVAFVFFLLAALGIAVLISVKLTLKIKAIADEVMSNSNVKAQFENGVSGLDDVLSSVKLLASHDIRTVADVSNRESVLDSLFLQSRVRDVYVAINDIEESVDISKSFFMVYFRVNYKEEFEKYIGNDSGRATFFLKQLIEMYLETWGIKATTFQIENNGIVSVFDTHEGFSGERDIVDALILKLENESEYAFFTVAVSDIYNGTEKLKGVYDALLDLSKYGKPVMETQILYENEVNRGASRFYFSVEEMGKLSALLQNGSKDDVVHKVDEILEFNTKKEINSFELHLLCTEIVNCAVKLVNRLLHAMPQDISLSEVYRKFERANTPDEYRSVCVVFLGEVMECIRQNKREDDYIISYILDYVDNHYAEDIYLNLFAEKLKLTGAYISSYFKEKMNVNLSDYVNNYRIKKAVELSENPQNKNKDIAVMVGLPNINTFIRLFKKYTGYTPGEYRKKHFGDDYKK